MNINHVRQPQNCQFITSDQTSLCYRYWQSKDTATSSEKRAVVLFHRGHEHSGRLQHIVDALNLPDFAFYAWDARGHGQSEGARGYSPSVGRSVQDVDEFMHHISITSGVAMKDIIIIAQSVAAVLIATWVHDYAPNIRGMILVSPAFKVKLYVPFARPCLYFWQKIKRCLNNTQPSYVNSYVKGNYLTHDPERIESYKNDPLITRPIAVNILLGLDDAATRVIQDAEVIKVPTLVLTSGADFVVEKAPQNQFYKNLGSQIKAQHVLQGFYHDTLGEIGRAVAFEKINTFIKYIGLNEGMHHDYQLADRFSTSADEWRQLQIPLSNLSAKGIYYTLLRKTMSMLGCCSRAMKLGAETGFDSGSTLDYVYKNKPDSPSIFGRWIDKNYLNSIGWRGIRIRKMHLEQMIQLAILQLAQEKSPINIVDIAAGHGRYVLDALQNSALRSLLDSVLLRDYSPINIEQGQKLLSQEYPSLSEIGRFELGDAFDRISLSALAPKPTLAVVSGLYELFPDNQLILDSLAGIAAAMPKGGILIYTNQPWHPQLEMIARALTSHRQGQSWVMRRRSQGEMDDLVARSGFIKSRQLIDEYGIFSVAMAVRA